MEKTNVFVLATEYHFLMAMCIIEEHFVTSDYCNKMIFTFRRLNDINESNLPKNIEVIRIDFDSESNLLSRVRKEIYSTEVQNLFMINVYRPLDTLIISNAPKGVTRHLMEEGALFYNSIEKSVYKNRIKEMYFIYTKLWRKGILFLDVILYGRFMETSSYVDEIWLTEPDLYIGPSLNKPYNKIKFSLQGAFYNKLVNCFSSSNLEQLNLDNSLIYLSPIMRNLDHIPIEVDQLKKILNHVGLSNVLVKLHPAAPDEQYNALRESFGDLVFRNYLPAELYIAKATNSLVLGCASTTLFYNNTSCKYFGLKPYYQKIGIYAEWKNINLPAHVKLVEEIEEIKF